MLEVETKVPTAHYPTRHLILLIDGTWASSTKKIARQRYSNIYWLNLFFETHNSRESTTSQEAQLSFYIPGLGTWATGTKKYSIGAFASELARDVEQAYINICANYTSPYKNDYDELVAGDKIYLFGFSRGAAIAHLVARIISDYGILHAGKIELFPRIWRHLVGLEELDVVRFRKDYCTDAEVEFLGVFDTVLGSYRGRDYEAIKRLFASECVLPERVKYALQILAMDETRQDFRPVLWRNVPKAETRLSQVWMPGVHTDIGGGYERAALSRMSLYLMLDYIYEHTTLSLTHHRLDELEREIRKDFEQNLVAINDERAGIWKMLGTLRGGERKFDPAVCNQFLHPICAALVGRSIEYKSERHPRQYSLQRMTELKDRIMPEEFFDSLRSGTRKPWLVD